MPRIPLKKDFFSGPCSQFLDDNDDAESQKFLANGMMKKKKFEEYHEEYVRGFTNSQHQCLSVRLNALIQLTVN